MSGGWGNPSKQADSWPWRRVLSCRAPSPVPEVRKSVLVDRNRSHKQRRFSVLEDPN